MKKKYILIVLFVVCINISMAQVPNAGFENWSAVGTFEESDAYATSNTIYQALDFISATTHPTSVFKHATAHTGNYAIKLQNVVGTKDSEIHDTLPGFAVTGKIVGADIIAGFPLSQRPASLTGFYTFVQGSTEANKKDTAAVIVGITKFNEESNETDSVGGGILTIYESVNSYTAFTLNIEYVDETSMPDTAYILLTSSFASKSPGTEFIVDALNFPGITNTQNLFSVISSIKFYPNPVQEEVTFTNIPANVKRLRIANTLGKEVYNDKINSDEYRIQLGELPSGIYIYYLENDRNEIVSFDKFMCR